jgi:hypothetical protein
MFREYEQNGQRHAVEGDVEAEAGQDSGAEGTVKPQPPPPTEEDLQVAEQGVQQW